MKMLCVGNFDYFSRVFIEVDMTVSYLDVHLIRMDGYRKRNARWIEASLDGQAMYVIIPVLSTD
jgi:hypothetical protein